MIKSIKKILTVRIMAILVVAFSILLIITYLAVSNIIHTEKEKYAKTLISVFSDYVVHESSEKNVPIDPAHPDITHFCANYVTNWYSIEYIFIYKPDTETNTIEYVDVCSSAKEKDKIKDFNMTRSHEFTEEELAVYNGETTYATFVIDNQYGKEFETIVGLSDSFGNRLIAGIDLSYDEISEKILQTFIVLVIIMLIIQALITVLIAHTINKRVSKPAKSISKAMDDFINNGKRQNTRLEIKTSDEFAMISQAFNRMSDDIEDYIDNINSLNSEKQKNAAEMEYAARLQQGLLPSTHMIIDDFNINAVMKPARDIGGDLYDYLQLDDIHTMIVIADVSGKGMPAGIFMSMTLVLIRQYARMGLSPANILFETNNALCEKNPKLLFTTAFLGIYNNVDKTLTYANAGHNIPYVISDSIISLDGGKGLILGVYENEKYNDELISLKTGDILFLYTDGVTEAIAPDNSFFGDKMLQDTLSAFKRSDGHNPVKFVFESLGAFSEGREQFDDATMLSLTIKDCSRLELDVDIKEFAKIKEAILSEDDLPRDLLLNLCVIAEEVFSNICYYAYKDQDTKDKKISFYFEHSYKIMLQFIDEGVEFDPTINMINPENYDVNEQIGGLGRFIAFNIADSVDYEYKDNRNILTITKYIVKGDETNEHF